MHAGRIALFRRDGVRGAAQQDRRRLRPRRRAGRRRPARARRAGGRRAGARARRTRRSFRARRSPKAPTSSSPRTRMRASATRRSRARACGGIGYHPSLLPRHRGIAAVEWTILEGDPIAGGSVYHLADGWDAGAIAAQDWCFVAQGRDGARAVGARAGADGPRAARARRAPCARARRAAGAAAGRALRDAGADDPAHGRR